ncbi:MAG TPA: TonB-dependent receptor, partial [Azonexus sp.]
STDQRANKYDANGNRLSSITDRSERQENEWVGELRGKRLFGDAHVVTAATELRGKASDDDQKRSGSQVSRTQAELDEFRRVIWAQDEWQVSEQHVLTPGLRWTLLDTKIDDSSSGKIDRTFRALDPSLHHLWQLSEQWNVRTSIARNSRVPFSRELLPVTRLSSGINSSSNADRGGNPQLEPERLLSAQFGVEYFLDQKAGTVGLSTFYRRIDDYIQRLTQQESGRWVERPYNVGEAEQTGFLFDYKSKLSAWGLPNLTLRGNASYTHTKMLERVPGLGAGEGPRKSLNLGADYEMPAYRLTLGGNFNYISALDKESSATIKQEQGARRQLDLYGLYKLDRQVALRFSAQNVTREDRRNDLEEVDANGLLQRTETDFSPGVATYMLTLEAKW